MGSVHKHSSGRSPYYFAKFRGADGTICVKSTKQHNWQKAVEVMSKWERAAQQAAAGSLTEIQARKVIGVPVICPMHPKLQKELRTRREKSPSEFVFPSLAIKAVSGKTGLSSQFQEIMLKAGITVPLGKKKVGRGRQFHLLGFHSLKHSFNSLLANGNVSQEVRRKLIGHKSDTVNDIYTHLDLARLSSAISHLPSI